MSNSINVAEAEDRRRIEASLFAPSLLSSFEPPATPHSLPVWVRSDCYAAFHETDPQTPSPRLSGDSIQDRFELGRRFVVVHGMDDPNESLLMLLWRHATGSQDCGKPHHYGTNLVATPTPGQRRVERLIKIQGAFGVSMHVLAQLLQISRAQLYKWMDASRDIDLQSTSLRRLSMLERIAEYWSSLTKEPLSALSHESVDATRTVLDVLSAPSVDERYAMQALRTVVSRWSAGPKSLSERMREAGFKSRRSSILSDE